MNNLTGDGNGYVGNNALKPEVARTLSASGDWHADDQQQWGVKLTPYYSYVDNYIGVQRCSSSLCGGAANVAATSGFVNLQYVNQNAQFYGVDLSGHVALGQLPGYGKFSARAVVNYTRGEDLSTGDNLYDIMPLNVNLTVQQGLGSWTNSAQLQVVAAKKDVSQVQDENQTGGYSLFNLMSSYQWKHLRVDFGIDNVFNRMYSLPLGGAYVGQGETMSESGVPWGIQVPGMGRSLYSALNYTF
jgi:iron complex outermembrane receptor protein